MNPSSSKAPKLRERLKEAVHEQILAAAEEEFAHSGLHQARMEKIAQRAGVAVGTLYNYFKDRDALVAQLLESGKKEMIGRMEAALAERADRPFEEQLQTFYQIMFEHFERHRPLLAVLMQAEHERNARTFAGGIGKHPTLIREVYLQAGKLVKRGVAQKVLRADDEDLFPALLVGLVRSALLHDILQSRRGPAVTDRAQALVTFFLRGAGA